MFLIWRHRLFGLPLVKLNSTVSLLQGIYRRYPAREHDKVGYIKCSIWDVSLAANHLIYIDGFNGSYGTWEDYIYRPLIEINKPAKRKEQSRRILLNITTALLVAPKTIWLSTMMNRVGALGVIIIGVEFIFLIVIMMLRALL